MAEMRVRDGERKTGDRMRGEDDMRRDAYFSLCSLHQACDRPPKLPQHQLQAGGEDDGVPGPGRDRKSVV